MKTLALIACFLTLPLLGWAQARFSASVDKNTVAEGEQIKLTIEANAQWEKLSPPDIGGFRVLSGPNQSSQTSFINGQMTQSFSYTYLITPAKGQGTFTIGPASAIIQGKTYQSEPITIKVVPESQRPRDPNDPVTIAKNNTFIRLKINKKELYVGEPIIATYELYFHYSISNYQVDPPVFTGFYMKDLSPNKNFVQRQETVGGMRYTVVPLQELLLIPQKSGALEIPAYGMDLTVGVPSNQRDFFGRQLLANAQISLKSEKMTIQVKALPEQGKPAGFSGAVGTFTMKAEPNKKELNADESVSYVVQIEGEGNLGLFSLPDPEIPTSLEKYDPKYSENISYGSRGMKGFRKNEYLIIPRYGGEYKIPALSFSYFDPSTEKYVTLNFGDQIIQVSGDAQASPNRPGPRGNEAVTYLDQDILDIKHGAQKWTPTAPAPSLRATALKLWLAIPVLAILLLLLWRVYEKANAARLSDTVSRAQKMAAVHFKNARKALTKQQKEDFFAQIEKGMMVFFAAKWKLPLHEINQNEITNRLSSNPEWKQDMEEVKHVLGTCAMHRYAGQRSESDQEFLTRAQQAIQKLDKKL